MYSLFELKLRKLKKYLKKNLQKRFIVFSQTTYVSLVLFAVKFNDQLRLCVNYRRLNYITKRNRYLIFFIEETLIKVQNCKYLMKLNIISTFNKLRMSEKSEKLITFVISMKLYKYRILFFELINDFASWQHYMNDFLFNFLNEFCQVYLNDILIYSKFKKKHIVHVCAMLKKLKKVDLQMNIEKCEFFKKKMIFLDVIFLMNNFRMNSKKMKIIINWTRFTNLKKVQVFVNFVNFYRRFIRVFRRKSKLSLEWSKNSWNSNELLKSKKSSIFSKRRWQKLLYFVIMIESSKSFWKSISQITLMQKCYLNTTTKKFYISLFFTVETWFWSNAITKFIIKNC